MENVPEYSQNLQHIQLSWRINRRSPLFFIVLQDDYEIIKLHFYEEHKKIK